VPAVRGNPSWLKTLKGGTRPRCGVVGSVRDVKTSEILRRVHGGEAGPRRPGHVAAGDGREWHRARLPPSPTSLLAPNRLEGFPLRACLPWWIDTLLRKVDYRACVGPC